MGDLISRADAIEALGEEPEIWNDTEEEWAYRNAWVEHISAIKALPSAEAEWIPCSERLPEKTGWYVVTVVGFETITDMLVFYKEASAWSDITDKQKVIAWQPLPTPYKGGDDE